jgi:tetratricopeptide (TPR) repeat protein
MRRAAGDERSVASILIELAELHHHLGEFAEARRRFDESLTLARELEDRYSLSICLDAMGYVVRQMGDLDVARGLHEESLALSREIGDVQGIAGSLDNLGLVAYDAGDLAEATRLFREGLALRQGSDNTWSWIVGISLEHLAGAALARGDLAEAERLARESLALLPRWAVGLSRMGDILRAQGKFSEAVTLYRTAIAISVKHNHLWPAPPAVHGLAQLRASEGDVRQAVALLRFAARHPACDYGARRAIEPALATLTSRLSAQELALAEADAQALTLERIVGPEAIEKLTAAAPLT